MKKRATMTFILAFVFVISVLAVIIPKFSKARYVDFQGNTEEESETEVIEEVTEATTISYIKVYISGEVNNKGVYEVDESMRIDDVIKLAGGVTPQADLERINLAEYIYDAMQIHIPSKSEENESLSQTAYSESGGKVNINTANIEQLKTLPQIGGSKAQEIINYRERVGKFKSIEDIKQVSGIGEKTFEAFKDRITI